MRERLGLHAYRLAAIFTVLVAVLVEAQDVAERSPDSGWVRETAIDEALRDVLSSTDFRYLLRRTREEADRPDEARDVRSVEPSGGGGAGLDPGMEGVGGAFGGIWRVLAYGFLLLVGACIIAFGVRAFIDRRRDDVGSERPRPVREPDWQLVEDPGRTPADSPWEGLVGEAEKLASRGDFFTAIGTLLYAGMSWAESRGRISYRAGLTNRDYVRALRGDRAARDAFAAIARHFEEIFFGRRVATIDRFEECLDAFNSGLRGAGAVGEDTQEGDDVVAG